MCFFTKTIVEETQMHLLSRVYRGFFCAWMRHKKEVIPCF